MDIMRTVSQRRAQHWDSMHITHGLEDRNNMSTRIVSFTACISLLGAQRAWGERWSCWRRLSSSGMFSSIKVHNCNNNESKTLNQRRHYRNSQRQGDWRLDEIVRNFPKSPDVLIALGDICVETISEQAKREKLPPESKPQRSKAHR